MNTNSLPANYSRVWEEFKSFDQTAVKLKDNWKFWQRFFFRMSIIGTILAAFSVIVTNTNSYLIGAAGAILLAIPAFLNKELFSAPQDLLWVKARSVAEMLKSEIFLCATRTPPYDRITFDTIIRENADKEIGNSVSLFAGGLEKPGDKQIPEIPMKLEEYIDKRIKDQLNYYQSMAKREEKATALWNTTRWVLGILGIVFATIATKGCKSQFIDQLVVLTGAIIGITTGYSIIKRSEFLSRSYGTLVERMYDLIAEGNVTDDPAVYIRKCEMVLTEEHRSWFSEWNKKINTSYSNPTV